MYENVFFPLPPTNYPVYFEKKVEEAYDFYKSRDHPEIEANTRNPKLLLDSYCEKFFRAKPIHNLQQKKVRYHLIISEDDKLVDGILYQHEIKLFGFIIASEPTLRKEDAELSSITYALKFLCEELNDKLSSFVSQTFDIDDYNIVDAPEETKPKEFDQNRYLKKSISPTLQIRSQERRMDYIVNKIHGVNREMFVQAYKTLSKSRDRESFLANPVLTFFNKFMAGFVKVPVKFLFYVPKVCNDISSVQEDLKDESCIMVKPEVEFVSNDKLTYALLAINQDLSQLAVLNKPTSNKIKYISLGYSLSKQKAKIDAVLKFFKYIDGGLYTHFVVNNPTEKLLETNFGKGEVSANQVPNMNQHNAHFTLEEYKKFRILEPLLVTDKTRCFELNPKHKTPKGLLQELFAKKFRSKLEDFVTFEITRGISTPHHIVMNYEGDSFSIEASTVKEGQEKLAQRLLAQIYKQYETYYSLLNDITTNKKDQVPRPFMESFKVNEISKFTSKLKQKIHQYKKDNSKRLVDMDSDLVVNEEYPDVSFYHCDIPVDFE